MMQGITPFIDSWVGKWNNITKPESTEQSMGNLAIPAQVELLLKKQICSLV